MVDSDFLNETSIASWLTCHLSCHSPSRCARRRVSQTMLPIARPRQGPLALAHLARKPFPSSVPSHRPRLRPPPRLSTRWERVDTDDVHQANAE
jgi:hypothetical protein